MFRLWRHVSAAHTAIFRPAYNRILWQCRVIASPVLNLGARWRHVVGFTFHILHPCKRSGGIQNLRANLDIGEGKYLFPMFGIELRFIGGPPHSKVTVLTELFLLWIKEKSSCILHGWNLWSFCDSVGTAYSVLWGMNVTVMVCRIRVSHSKFCTFHSYR